MYALVRQFAIRVRRGPALGLLAAAGGSALLAGCVGNPFANAQVDPDSPVAGEVAKVANPSGPYPTFASIPPAPKDVRPPGQYGRDARVIERAGADLDAVTAPETWSLQNTDAFSAQACAAVGAETAP